ncbi:MAG: hypothetical protein AAF320_04455 [Myxococcota bacterium]
MKNNKMVSGVVALGLMLQAFSAVAAQDQSKKDDDLKENVQQNDGQKKQLVVVKPVRVISSLEFNQLKNQDNVVLASAVQDKLYVTSAMYGIGYNGEAFYFGVNQDGLTNQAGFLQTCVSHLDQNKQLVILIPQPKRKYGYNNNKLIVGYSPEMLGIFVPQLVTQGRDKTQKGEIIFFVEDDGQRHIVQQIVNQLN